MKAVKRRSTTTKKVGRTTKIFGNAAWAGLFTSRALARILTALMTHAQREFYQKELAEAAGVRLYPAQRELARLEKAGLVARVRRGNRVYYKVRREHPAYEDLRRVIVKTLGLGETLRAALEPLAGRVRAAFIYGSFARGDERADSDIDVFVVGDLSLRETSEVLGPAGRSIGREISARVYAPEELRAKVAEGRHFVAEVLKGDKVFLVGDERELKGIVG